MNQTEALLRALKRVLKSRGMRYADLAQGLEVSEQTIKRMLSTHGMDLARLERVCSLLEIDFLDLARMARGTRHARNELSAAQESALAASPPLLIVFHLLCNEWQVAAIRREFAWSEAEVVRLLARLDRLRLIELLPRNRVRMCVPRDFTWRDDGAVRRRYAHAATAEFLRDDFAGREAVLATGLCELSDASIAVLGSKLRHLAAEFRELGELDAALPQDQRRSVGILVALRPWVFSLIESLRAEATAMPRRQT